jgi:hypothetical protein
MTATPQAARDFAQQMSTMHDVVQTLIAEYWQLANVLAEHLPEADRAELGDHVQTVIHTAAERFYAAFGGTIDRGHSTPPDRA